MGRIHKTGGFDKRNPFVLYNLNRKWNGVFLQKIIATFCFIWYTDKEIRVEFVFLHFLTMDVQMNLIYRFDEKCKNFSWRNELQ